MITTDCTNNFDSYLISHLAGGSPPITIRFSDNITVIKNILSIKDILNMSRELDIRSTVYRNIWVLSELRCEGSISKNRTRYHICKSTN